jgi:hypothetical protein
VVSKLLPGCERDVLSNMPMNPSKGTDMPCRLMRLSKVAAGRRHGVVVALPAVRLCRLALRGLLAGRWADANAMTNGNVDAHELPVPMALRLACDRSEASSAWLEQLPHTVAEASRRWSLSLHAPYADVTAARGASKLTTHDHRS